VYKFYGKGELLSNKPENAYKNKTFNLVDTINKNVVKLDKYLNRRIFK
jgi:hypothetical protein